MSATLAGAWADVDSVVDELRDAGTDGQLSVELDPARIVVPGVWCAVDRLQRGRLSGDYVVKLRLHLVAADTDLQTSRDQLAALADQLLPVVDTYGGPSDPLTFVTVLMPDGSRLPGMVVPVDIETE